MRLRNVKNAEMILKESPYFVLNPESYLGVLRELFGNDQPIHLEIGTGKGNFLIGMAKKYPHINFIGIEKYDSVLVRAIQKCQEENLSNIKFMCMDAKRILEVFRGEIEILYLNFSDPWPKNRHHERRLTSQSFLKLYDGIFKGDCHIIQKTDNIILFASSLEDLSKYGYVLEKVCLDLHHSDIFSIETEYETKFSDLGYKINYVEAKKKK
ncbi:MAG: tRNA (guanosine(46)-N7)-methyltransferase TrmB [Bacilli bacterium]|nr:tRNA (guanosine(46)-N7)-methyltransferase TrmB [Bacilli bacterium]